MIAERLKLEKLVTKALNEAGSGTAACCCGLILPGLGNCSAGGDGNFWVASDEAAAGDRCC